MQTRYIQEIGTRGQLRIYWDVETVTELHTYEDGYVGTTSKSSYTCPNTYGTGRPGIHNAYTFLKDVPEKAAWKGFGEREDYPAEMWPTQCRDCGAPVPAGSDRVVKEVGWSGIILTRQVSTTRLYDTASGDPEPGCIYETAWHEDIKCPYWSNCTGVHVHCILPNGDHWDITSRASNCTMKDDRTHRCWVRHGSYKDGTISVNKDGFTCSAGAGSIASTGWHGFLTNGQLVA